ncbi:YihY/virulence factor BrkB family protein [Halobacteriales archaeon QS_1_67_19]|nr:MAG: YihY/virulence factor BrkB family protein [Halobacteriales archaeon QS_1_67_19]
MGGPGAVRQVIEEAWREVRAENVAFMAGSIAYYAFVSMLPLLLFSLIVLSIIGSEALTAYLTRLTASFLTPYARQLLLDSLDATATQTSVSLIGVLTLAWGTSRIFRALDVAFSEIYESHASKTLRDKATNGLVVFVALAGAIGIIVAAGAAVTVLPDLPFPDALSPVVLVLGLGVAFFPIYYVFPDVTVTPLEVLPGTAFAAVGWATLEAAFQLYVAVAGRYEAAYGTLGSALLLLVWLYGSGFILLVGAVINAVLAGRTGDRHVVPVTEEVSARDRPSGSRSALGSDSRGAGPGTEGRDAGGEPVERGGSGQVQVADDRPAIENRRLRGRAERLERENEQLRREKRELARRLARRRIPLRERAKRWLFGD